MERQQTIRQVALATKIERSEIFFAEEGRAKNGMALFQTYLNYADYFGISLADLFQLTDLEMAAS